MCRCLYHLAGVAKHTPDHKLDNAVLTRMKLNFYRNKIQLSEGDPQLKNSLEKKWNEALIVFSDHKSELKFRKSGKQSSPSCRLVLAKKMMYKTSIDDIENRMLVRVVNHQTKNTETVVQLSVNDSETVWMSIFYVYNNFKSELQSYLDSIKKTQSRRFFNLVKREKLVQVLLTNKSR